ncbi:peptidase C14 caspase catalytic subunit [Candidatus Scalindua japonica]|uniref:Peptidase C14 caspase catalytic subunit n=1 Tax=Candidatus Scalindua japonica TaxID=1284222 RepID=A0A286TV85_9BACT|nr:peptidase C14 caspase catalytic subunit [Candidatus Scalindua japonica]
MLVSPTGNEIQGNQWLFVIGIDSYTNLPYLNTSVNNAKAVKGILLKRYYFDDYHVIELYNGDATRRNILGKLRYLTRRVGPEDSVIIFYSGHGGLDSSKREGGWIPVEGSMEESSSWVSNREVFNYLKIGAIQAKHVLLIVDSCFSGDYFRRYKGELPRATDEVIKQAYKLRSRQVITSGGIKPVAGDVMSENSIFTHFLIKGLEENKNPFLISSELFKVVKSGVEKNSDQAPGFGMLNDKGVQKAGELVVFLNENELARLKEISWKERVSRKRLRSSYKDLSVTQIQSMPYIEIREDQEWGVYGHSTIRHQYEAMSIVYDKIVIDHTTGLMWHQNGSERFKDREKISEWVDNLNLKGYAGFSDWRLPTAEEAASLLEPEKKFGAMYVDSLFDKKQTLIWTGDSYGPDAAWIISFCFGSVFWNKFDEFFCIRPVRTMQ